MRWVLLGVGSVCVSLSFPGLAPLLTYKRAVGVIEIRQTTVGGEPQSFPTVRYTQDNGAIWGHTPSPGELPTHYQAGDTVTVLYRWKDSVIATPRLWLRPVATCAFGVLLLVLGLTGRAPRLRSPPC